MNKQQYFNDIVAKFNENPNHPALSPIERSALFKIMQIEKTITELNDKLNALSKDVDQKQQEIGNIQLQVIKERGKSEGIQEVLVSMME